MTAVAALVLSLAGCGTLLRNAVPIELMATTMECDGAGKCVVPC